MVTHTMVKEIRRLAERFRQQEEFTKDYSPLYACLFGLVADWLESPVATEDPLVTWLVDAGLKRRSLDVTLLLAAGLHRDVLAGDQSATNLAQYFPTVGGERSPDDPGFEGALREAILLRRSRLRAFIQRAIVQTNETGRGLCWLLPVMSMNWERVQLVDLGASAGLNLLAERRAYRLVEARSGSRLLDLGQGYPEQFVTKCRGYLSPLGNYRDRTPPRIVGRIGCDLAPFPLSGREDELTLTSFIWGDQVARVQRLREGIEAFRQVEISDAPVKLYQIDLPDELNRFLHQHVPTEPHTPVVLYNTWMTSYLHDKGQSMMYHVDQWANGQKRPVLWLQWEPPRDGSEPPEYGWCAWTADLWQSGEHHHWRLGWAHPHGGQVEFGEGLSNWDRRWSSNRVTS
jgi:hypothetical protein